MSKELLKELKKTAEEFKYEPDTVKKKARDMYKLCLKAFDRIDYLQAQLDAYKAPTLVDRTATSTIPEREYVGRAERIQGYLDMDPNCESDEFQSFLKWNKLSLIQAKDLVYKSRQVK